MKDWKCLLVSAAFITSGLMANDGVLPRGKGQQPAASPVTTSVPELYSKEDEKLFPIDCSTYLANPNNGEFFIAPGKQLLYFLSRSAGEAQRVDAKTYIYEIDLNARNSRRIVGLKLDTNPIMIGHGLPLEGASVFDLKKGRASCGEGVSAGVGVQWAKQQRIVKNFLSSRYKLIATDQGNNFADLDQGIVQGFDFTTLQKRTLTTFPKDHVPLYAEFQPPKVIAVQPEKAELHLFTGGNKQPDSILVLKKGAKFVQNGGLFGLLEIGTEPQKIQLRTIKGWSG